MTGKKLVTVILKEDYNSEIYFLISRDFYSSELFEKIRLKYFINNLKETDTLKKKILCYMPSKSSISKQG